MHCMCINLRVVVLDDHYLLMSANLCTLDMASNNNNSVYKFDTLS